MKCPILSAGALANPTDDVGPYWDCLQDECAWWSGAFGKCSVNALAQGLRLVQLELADIKKTIAGKGSK
jgi:hypothetical protein